MLKSAGQRDASKRTLASRFYIYAMEPHATERAQAHAYKGVEQSAALLSDSATTRANNSSNSSSC